MHKLTYRFKVEPIPELENLCRISKDLYNQSLYELKKKKEEKDIWLGQYELFEHMKTMQDPDGNIVAKMMCSDTSNYVVKQVCKNVKSFFALIRKWKKNPEMFRKKPEFPHFLPNGSMNLVQIRYKHDCRISNKGIITIGMVPEVSIPIPQWGKYKKIGNQCKLIRILPFKRFMIIEIIYEAEYENRVNDKNRIAAIDFGVNNLATVVTPEGSTIFSGKPLKSYNQYFNKEMAHYTSIKVKQGIEHGTKRISKLNAKRHQFVETFMHTTSRAIVNLLIEQHIGKLVVGRNVGWKNHPQMRQNNQKFMFIPFRKLQSMLKYKCEMAGIEYVEQEESYTSKCDALAFESIEHHDKYVGRRKHRGLFISSTGQFINADQNGALNILRKNIGDEEYKIKTQNWNIKSPVRIKHPQKMYSAIP